MKVKKDFRRVAARMDTVPGNAAAMHDALLKLRAEIGKFYNNEWIPYDAWQGCDDVISHALSEPPRQCDVGTEEEQRKRFRLFCESHKPEPAKSEFTETGELLCPSSGCELGVCNYGQCALRWAQTPYEAEEGGAE